MAARLKAAGGIIIGKTNVASMLYDFQTESELFGRTNNPWDVTRTPGGSSGGSAAALALGLTPLEVGSDIGGSVRVPAAFCGVVGFKPTEGRIPETGHMELPHPRGAWIMESIGPLGRTVEDAAWLFEILAGPDGEDPTVPPVPLRERRPMPLAGLRIAVATCFPGERVQTEIRDALTGLARSLEAQGAVLDERLPEVDWAE